MIYLFNNNEEMIRIIPNSAIKRMYQTQTLTDENYISDRLDVEIQALNDEELSELEYVAIDDIENPQRFHYYFIVKETTEHQITTLTGVQSGIEELRKTPVYDMRPTNLSPKLIADRLLEGTNWQAGYTTDDVGTISTNFYYTDVFGALKKMCMAFDIEMQFFVEITTNRIGARYIEFRKRTGKSVGKRVVYGHNALKIVKEVEKTNTITALIGRGKGVQVSESDEGNIGYGRKIGFENVEWKKSSGAPVDKPLGQEFVEIPELTLQYGIKNSNGTVRPKIGFVEFQDEESETRLIDRTYNALLELSRPQVLLETSSVYLPDTGIGDTINVVRHDRDLRYQTRVFEITWDRLANKAVDMKLGDRLGESENKRISRISNQVSGNISTELGPTIDELVDRLTTADGKNTNWYTDYDPMENPETMGLVRVNDNWWQPDPEYEGEFILKQWNGEMWVEILRTSGNQELVRRFEEIEQQAQDLADDIEASDQKADEAKEVAGLAKSAVDAYGLIAQETADKMMTVEQIVATAESNAKESLAKAGSAVANAQTAMGNAQSALSKASDAESTVSTLSKEVDTVAGEVKLKAEQTEVDTLSGTVSTHSTTLSQQATAIASKAEQEEVDTVKGTVSTHTSTLEQQAKDISARLTESQVNSLVSGKGYATQTWSNQTFATPQSVSTQLKSYAKTTDLNGMVTETTLATKNFITAGSVNTLLTSYAKTDSVPTLTNFNSLKNSYDSMEQVIGTTNDSVARAVMTSNLWETEVSKVIDEELEQEFKTVEGEVPFHEYIPNPTRTLLEGDRSITIYLPTTADTTMDGKRVIVEMEYKARAGSKGNHASYIQYGTIKSSEPLLYSSLTNVKYHLYIPPGTAKGNIMDLHTNIVNPGNFTWGDITKITVSTVEKTQVPVSGTKTGAISTKITQLYDMINLSVLGKEGAMSRIAMGEEGIQIDGKLLHITAKTYIDDAVIKSAMIDTLDAGKITTGELNASLIRVVNLDANSITGNEASFIKAMFSGVHSTLQITGNGINILDNAGRTATHFDNRGIEFYEKGTKIGNLEYVNNVTDSGAYNGFNGISFRPERDSYFGVSYWPSGSSTSIRRFSVSGSTGRVYMHNLYPSESSSRGLEFVRYTLSGETGTVIRNTVNNSGIFFGDNGRLSFLENGTWTASPV